MERRGECIEHERMGEGQGRATGSENSTHAQMEFAQPGKVCSTFRRSLVQWGNYQAEAEASLLFCFTVAEERALTPLMMADLTK